MFYHVSAPHAYVIILLHLVMGSEALLRVARIGISSGTKRFAGRLRTGENSDA